MLRVMSYVSTPAAVTASASRYLGDGRFIPPHAALNDDGLGFAWIAPIAQGVAALAATGFTIYQARKDAKSAKSQASAAEQAAREQAKLTAAQRQQVEAQTAQMTTVPAAASAPEGSPNRTLLVAGAVGVAALAAVFLLRRKR